MSIRRRDFTKVMGAMALASGVSADPLGLPIGIQLYTVGDDMTKDAAATVKKIAGIGYKEVETAGFGSLKTAAALRKVLDENGLKCPSAHLTFDLKNLNAAFDDAHTLGCAYATSSVPRLILSGTPALDGGPEARAAAIKKIVEALSAPMPSDELKRLIEAMNTIGAAAKKQGLVFASHNHTFEFQMVDGQPALYEMMAKTDAASVKFEIDCGWATVAGYKPVDIAAKFPGRVKMLHIKDFLAFEKGAAPGGANSPAGSEIGQGVVDYKAILAGMKGKGIEHLFVEQEGPFSRMPAMSAAEVDYKYLHSVAG